MVKALLTTHYALCFFFFELMILRLMLTAALMTMSQQKHSEDARRIAMEDIGSHPDEMDTGKALLRKIEKAMDNSPKYDLKSPETTPEGQLMLNPKLTRKEAIKLAKKDYNRRNAARARYRNKSLHDDLQQRVYKLIHEKQVVMKERTTLEQQIVDLKRQNANLVQMDQKLREDVKEGSKASVYRMGVPPTLESILEKQACSPVCSSSDRLSLHAPLFPSLRTVALLDYDNARLILRQKIEQEAQERRKHNLLQRIGVMRLLDARRANQVSLVGRESQAILPLLAAAATGRNSSTINTFSGQSAATLDPSTRFLLR
jgi:hypothetical protein